MGVDAEMFFKVPYNLTDEEINDAAYRLADAVGADHFFISLDGKFGGKHLALSRVALIEQDGPTIIPEEDETFIKVHLWGRYYGPHYERGGLWTYIATAIWIEHNIREAAVYYGGDSSGVCAEPFNEDSREELINHWTVHGHRPYRESFGRMGSNDIPQPEGCGMCNHKMTRCGWGKDFASYYCPGCGMYKKTHDNGETWEDEKKVV